MATSTSAGSCVVMHKIHTSVALRGVEEVKAPNFPDSVTEGDAKCVMTLLLRYSCLNSPSLLG